MEEGQDTNAMTPIGEHMAQYTIQTLTDEQKESLGVAKMLELEGLEKALEGMELGGKLLSDAIRHALKEAESADRKAKRVAEQKEKHLKTHLTFTVDGNEEDGTDTEDYDLKSILIVVSEKFGKMVYIGGGHDNNAVVALRKTETPTDERDYEVVIDTKQKHNSKNCMLVRRNADVVSDWIADAVRRFPTLDGIIAFLLGITKADGTTKFDTIDLDALNTLAKNGDKKSDRLARKYGTLYTTKFVVKL